MNAIEIRNLYKHYGTTQALRGLNITVPGGHIYGFLGPNGAGKTTTIKILLGLLKKDRGSAKIFGEEVLFAHTEQNKKVGFVPEEFSLYGYISGEEIINFNTALYRKTSSKEIEKLQGVFNLPLNEKISTYSRGMKKLLSLYIALSTEPELLILDEPTDGLDPIVRNKLLNILIEEAANRNLTIFFSSHILSEVEKVADIVGFIKKGKTMVEDDIDTIKENACTITFKAENVKEPFKCKELGNNIFRCEIFKEKDKTLDRLKKAHCTILNVAPIPFEEIFMHYMEENDENTI